MLIYADITERKRAEETIRLARDAAEKALRDLRAAQDRLVQTEKLASLGQLTAGIAHEIENPLNFVNNFSALSVELTDELNDVLIQVELVETVRKETGELTAMLKDNLSKIVQHGKRADSIVKNMLLHSREGSGEHRPVEINAIIDESLNLAYHGARAERQGFNITLERELDPAAGVADIYPQEPPTVTAAEPSAVAKSTAGPLAWQQRHFLPEDLAGALKRLDDGEIDALLAAVTTEAERRRPRPAKKKPVADAKPQPSQEAVEDRAGSLTTGKLNAVRAAFRAGVKPSAIARQFGISQSDVRKALTQGPHREA